MAAGFPVETSLQLSVFCVVYQSVLSPDPSESPSPRKYVWLGPDKDLERPLVKNLVSRPLWHRRQAAVLLADVVFNAGASEVKAEKSQRSERWRRFPYSTFCWCSLLSHGKCFW